jgi:hypothetical protein
MDLRLLLPDAASAREKSQRQYFRWALLLSRWWALSTLERVDAVNTALSEWSNT